MDAKLSTKIVKIFSMTRAYLLALALIAGTMISTYLIVSHKVRTNIDKASVNNTAGMQRMLSQRIGLLSKELITADTAELKNTLTEKLELALQKFSDNHYSLYKLATSSTTSEAIKTLYAGDRGVDKRSRQFISLAKQISDEALGVAQVTQRQRDLTAQLVTIARNGFLQELDAVVQEHENQATNAVAKFLQLELVILIIGLSLLLFEAVFIFRPIVKTSANRQKHLEKSNKELMEFSFRISHDLRAPVASSRGMIEIALDAIEDDDKELAADVVGRTNTLLLRLESLIEDIIRVTRNNITEAEPELVDLPTIVANTMEELSAMPGYDKCTFDVNVDTDSKIHTKKLYLQQIVQNLVSNAIKYSDHENDEDISRISISFRKSGKDNELIVDDNGIGIPESCQRKVFDMFARFHPNVANGSGLGLYLTYQNAVALGGKLRYEPLKKGSRFVLSFQPE